MASSELEADLTDSAGFAQDLSGVAGKESLTLGSGNAKQS